MKTMKTRPNSLIGTIASNKGYGQNNTLVKLTYLLSYPQSRDAIASKKYSNHTDKSTLVMLIHDDQYVHIRVKLFLFA